MGPPQRHRDTEKNQEKADGRKEGNGLVFFENTEETEATEKAPIVFAGCVNAFAAKEAAAENKGLE